MFSFRYYTTVVALIVLALVLQVIVGVLAIFVTQTRNYYQKYHSDMCEEFRANWCACISRQRDSRPTSGVDNLGFRTTSGVDNIGCRPTSGVDNLGLNVSSVEVHVEEEELGGIKRNGLGALMDPAWSLPTASNTDLDELASDMEESVSVRLMRAEIIAIEAQVELDRLNLDHAREKKRTLSSSMGKVSGSEIHTDVPEAGQEETCATGTVQSETHKRLMTIEADIAKCEATIKRALVLRRQHEFLSTYVDGTHDEEILKKVSFWQNVINYLLYAVFTCNAFITGLGVSGGQDNSTGGN